MTFMLCVYVLLNNVISKQFQPNYGVWDGLLLKRGTESGTEWKTENLI